MVYKHLRLNTNGPNTNEVDYLECKSACLDAPIHSPHPTPYCSWFSVNYSKHVCLLFQTCDSLISQEVTNGMLHFNGYYSSSVCCDYYKETIIYMN